MTSKVEAYQGGSKNYGKIGNGHPVDLPVPGHLLQVGQQGEEGCSMGRREPDNVECDLKCSVGEIIFSSQFTNLAMISFNCFSFAFLLGKFTAANSFSTAWGGIIWLYVEVGDNSLQTRDKSSEGE